MSGGRQSSSPLNLDTMPAEMLVRIFEHVPPRELVSKVQFVCKKFNALIANKQWWFARIYQSNGVRLAECEIEGAEFEPARSFVHIYEEAQRWDKWKQQTRKIGAAHISTVDALKLFRDVSTQKRFCLSGGRDRTINLWDIASVEEESADCTKSAVIRKDGAHSGWIWSMDHLGDDRFISCGWDCMIRLWSITPTDITETGSSRVGSAATSLLSSSDASVAICGTFLKKVCLLDIRNGLEIVDSYAHHKGPVFSLAQKDNLIYSCGEDRRVVMVDRRNCKVPVVSVSISGYVQTLSLANNLLLMGTLDGEVLTYRPDNLSLICKHSINEPIRQVIHTRGSLLVATKSRKLKVFSPGVEPELLGEVCDLESEPSRFDYVDGDLVVSAGSGDIAFWTNPSRATFRSVA